MKQNLLALFVFLALFTVVCCCKHLRTTDEKGDIVTQGLGADTITADRIDRHDVSPPPAGWVRNVDTSGFSYCEKNMWKYLRNVYPISDPNYWGYNIYALSNEPEDAWARRSLVQQMTYFFLDTVYRLPDPLATCGDVTSDFFLDHLGEPTCIVDNQVEKIYTYFYQFKLRDRCGPCAYIYDEGQPFQQKCMPDHFKYCGLLKVTFSKESKKMRNVLFFGSSC